MILKILAAHIVTETATHAKQSSNGMEPTWSKAPAAVPLVDPGFLRMMVRPGQLQVMSTLITSSRYQMHGR
jgi:hypothetical protein